MEACQFSNMDTNTPNVAGEIQEVLSNLGIPQLINIFNYIDSFGSPLLTINNTKSIRTNRKTQDLIVAISLDGAAQGREAGIINRSLRNNRDNNGTREPQPELKKDSLPISQAL